MYSILIGRCLRGYAVREHAMSGANGDCSERSSETRRADWSHRWDVVRPALPCASGWKLAAREAFAARTLGDHERSEIGASCGFLSSRMRACGHGRAPPRLFQPTETLSPTLAWLSLRGSMFRVLSPASPPPFVVSVVSSSFFRHCCSYSRLGHAHTTVTFVTT